MVRFFCHYGTFIFVELSKEDQFDVIGRSIKHSIESFKQYYKAFDQPEYAEVLKIFKFLRFFEDYKALHSLAKLRNQSTEPIGRFLIRAVSISIDFQKNIYHYSNCLWAFLYYITELLLTDQNSKFREFYKAEIENNGLIEKLELLKKITGLRNTASKLSPKGLIVQHIRKNEVWKNLKANEVSDGFDKYFDHLEQLEKDVKVLKDQLIRCWNSYLKATSSYGSLDVNDREESIRAMLGFWIYAGVNKFIPKKLSIKLPKNLAQVVREAHLPNLQKAKEI